MLPLNKNTFKSAIERYCRLFMKLGSGVFLLFFMIAAPAAPVIAQWGSAAFIFLLLLLSPFVSNSAKQTAALPEAPSPICQQLDDAVMAHDLITFPTNKYQNVTKKQTAAEKPLAVSYPYQEDLIIRLIEYLDKKPEKPYYPSQPVRAGPAFIFA